MPKFLPYLPKPQQDRLEALLEREADKFWRGVERVTRRRFRSAGGGPGLQARADPVFPFVPLLMITALPNSQKRRDVALMLGVVAGICVILFSDFIAAEWHARDAEREIIDLRRRFPTTLRVNR